MVYFLAGLKEKPLRHWAENGGCLWDSLLFYTKFPVTPRELSDRKGCIPAVNLSGTIKEMLRRLPAHHDFGSGKSESDPLRLQVLADRRACVFIELERHQVQVIGNVFKISDSFILRGEAPFSCIEIC